MTLTAHLLVPTRTVARPRRDVRLPLGFGVLATFLAALGSWIPSLWGDEGTSVMSAERSLPSLFRMLGYVDAVHGSYYLGLHFWIKIFGASPFSVRFPPAIAVGFAVAAVVMVARELGDRRLAIIVGVVACVLPRVTYMGEETRAYAFSAALAGWAMWALIRLVTDRGTKRRWWIAYGLLMVAGTYAFLYFGLFVVVHLLIVLSTRPNRAFVRRWVTTVIGVVVLALPIIALGFAERNQIGFLARRTTVTFTSVTVGLWFTSTWFAIIAWILVLTAAAVGAVHLVRRIRCGTPSTVSNRTPNIMVVALAWLVLPVTILLLGNVAIADFSSRYLSYSAPAAALSMAIGIHALTRLGTRVRIAPRITAVVALVVVVAIAAPVYVSQRTPYAKNSSDWAEISETVGAHAHPGDAVVFDESTRPSRRPRLALHIYPTGFTGLLDVTLETPYQDSDTWHDTAYTVAQSVALGRFTGIHRVWLIDYATPGTTDTYGRVDLKAAGYTLHDTYTTHRSRILEYVKTS